MKNASPMLDGHPRDGGGGTGHPPGAVKGVLFDFDGTLTAPGALDFPAIKRRLGCPVEKPILEYLQRLPASERAALTAVLDAEEIRAAEASEPNDGAETCILKLMEMGCRLGILTRNSLGSVHIAFRHFQRVRIEDFTSVITRDGSPPKPHPDGVFRAAAEMGLKPAELMVVGDFRFDIMAGHAAGSTTVLLVYGDRNPMVPGDPAPDYMIRRLDEVPGILKELHSIKRPPGQHLS